MKRRLVIIATLALALVPALPAMGGGRPLEASLSGVNEVPANDSPAMGHADVTLNQGQQKVCVKLEITGLLGDVLAGHIHTGPSGVNGGIAVNLEVSSAEFTGCVDDVPKDVIKDIRQNPDQYYVNIHTTAIPSGEVRGQLSK